jgi:hypothetical protein
VAVRRDPDFPCAHSWLPYVAPEPIVALSIIIHVVVAGLLVYAAWVTLP